MIRYVPVMGSFHLSRVQTSASIMFMIGDNGLLVAIEGLIRPVLRVSVQEAFMVGDSSSKTAKLKRYREEIEKRVVQLWTRDVGISKYD